MAELKSLKAMVYLKPALAEKQKEEESITKKIFLQLLKKQFPNFCINGNNRAVINNLYRWCLRDTEGKFNPRKGLWIYGNIGTGKSTIMKAILEFMQKYWLIDCGERICTNWMSAPAFCGNYADFGFSAFDEIPTGIDELGTESMPTNYRGNKLNVIAYIISSMSERCNGVPMIITTNLSFSDVKNCYGARAVDRIGVLFNLVEMKGDSWRKDSDVIWDMIESEMAYENV